MPNAFLSIDQNFPKFTGTEKPDEKIRIIQNYLFQLVEYLRYVLNNLTEQNFNDKALTDFIDEIRAGIVVADVVISNTAIINNLYATFGDVSELTTDRLLTANKVENYWASNTNDINYINVQGQYIKFMTGDTDGSTTQHTDRNGNLLYYNGEVTAETYKTVGMTTNVTAYPVTVYDYTTLTKMELSFTLTDGVYEVDWILGAGTGEGDNGKLRLHKDTTGGSLTYLAEEDGAERKVRLDNDGVFATGIDVCHTATNYDSVSVSSETTVVEKNFTLDLTAKLVINFSCEIAMDGAASVTAKTYLDGVALTYQPTLYCANAQSYILTYADFCEYVTAGAHTVTVKLQTSASSGSLITSHARLILQAFTKSISPYQQWAGGLHDSPLPTSEFPYQCIAYTDPPYLFMSKTPLHTERSFFGERFFSTEGESWQFNYGTYAWIDGSFYTVPMDFAVRTTINQANHAVYENTTYTTVYFAQTTP